MTVRTLGALVLVICAAIAVAVLQAPRGITHENYEDSLRTENLRKVVDAISIVEPSKSRSLVSAELRPAVCSAYLAILRKERCEQQLNALVDAMNSFDGALRSLGPSNSSTGNSFLANQYALDRSRVAQHILNGDFSAAWATRTLRVLANRSATRDFPAQLEWVEHARSEKQRSAFGKGSYARMPVPMSQRSNPWEQFNGCVYLRGPSSKGAAGEHLDGLFVSKRQRQCAETQVSVLVAPTTIDPNVLMRADDWESLTERLLAGAQFEASQNAVFGGNVVNVYGRPVPQGAHAVSSVRVREQTLAQQVAECFAGSNPICESLQIDNSSWSSHYEGAAARMMGILLVDLKTGRIETAASAHTRCYTEQHDGPGRSEGCPDIPAPPSKRDGMLVNHALHGQAMPGSLVKPITSLALLADSPYSRFLLGQGSAEYQRDIKHSDSARFHDRLFCRDKNFIDCDRPKHVAKAAEMLGWNAGCVSAVGTFQAPDRTRGNTLRCGELSLITGVRASEKAGETVSPGTFSGRIGIQPRRPPDLPGWEKVPAEFSPAWARACSKQGWSKCKGGTLSAVDLLAEAWGQGSALATPVGIAQMMTTLGAAANGNEYVQTPHLLSGWISGQFRPYASPKSKVAIPRSHAQLIVSGMALGHSPGGTSASACVAVLGNTACKNLKWIAGKTGTPVFNHDRLSVAQRAELCTRGIASLGLTEGTSERRKAEQFHCFAPPIKWYAALVKSDRNASSSWDKAIVVIAERNWNKETGLIDSPGDRGVNISARAAFEVLSRLY